MARQRRQGRPGAVNIGPGQGGPPRGIRGRQRFGRPHSGCLQWEYRCEWTDPTDGSVIDSSFHVIVLRYPAQGLRAAYRARQEAMARHVRPPTDSTDPSERRRRQALSTPGAKLSCYRVAGPYQVPGPC